MMMMDTVEKDPLESVGEEFAQGLKKVIDEVRKVWAKVGYDDEQCRERIESLKKRSFASLQDILNEETQEKNRKWEAIIMKLQDISSTSSAVNEPCPRIDITGLTYIQAEATLNKILGELSEIKRVRAAEVNQLIQSINENLAILGKDSLSSDLLVVLNGDDLSKIQIYNLRKENNKLCQIRSHRREALAEIAGEIKELYRALGPKTLFLHKGKDDGSEDEKVNERRMRDIVNDCVENDNYDVHLTSEDFFCALEIREMLEEVKAQRETQIKKFSSEIRKLYLELFDGKEIDLSVITSNANPLYKENIDAYKSELERLKEIKKQKNLEKIKELDAELGDILEKIGPCRAAGDKESLMSSVYSGDINSFSYAEIENVIELYRDVIDSRKEILKEKTRLCTQIEKFIKLNALRQQFLTKEEDSRLMYSSTQPDIARKLRTMTAQKEAIRKNLPAIERDIKSSLCSWKEMYGDDFLYNGKDNYAVIIDAEEKAYAKLIEEHKRKEQQKRLEKSVGVNTSVNVNASTSFGSTFGSSTSFAGNFTAPVSQPQVVQTPRKVVKKVVVVTTAQKGKPTVNTPAPTPISTKAKVTKPVGSEKQAVKRRKNVISPIPKKLNASCKYDMYPFTF